MDVEVKRRNQGQWFVRYRDPSQAIDGQTEPAVLHTTHWTGERLYFDPDAHPTANRTHAGKYVRKLRDVVRCKIVVMQVDADSALRASGAYQGEFRVIEAKIAEDGSHALILEPTGRTIVMER